MTALTHTPEVLPPGDTSTLARADIPAIFDAYKSQLEALKQTALTIQVTDVTQVAQMALARSTRLALRDVRLECEKRRVELGEEHLRATQRINQQAKLIKDAITPLEARLQDAEDFAKRQEEARLTELRLERHAAMMPFVSEMPANLEYLSVDKFQEMVDSAETLFNIKKARIAADLAAQKRREEENAAERQRVLEDNARLKREAEEATRQRKAIEDTAAKERHEAQIKLDYERQQAHAQAQRQADAQRKEHDALEAKHRAEQQKRAAAEKELADKKAVDAKAIAEWEAAQKRMADAPDRDKLLAFAESIRALPLPPLSVQSGYVGTLKMLERKITDLCDWIRDQAK